MIVLKVKVLPNRKINRIIKKSDDGSFRIELKAKPVEGQANRELVKYLSKMLDISQSQISIIKGLHSPLKNIEIDSMNQNLILEKIDKAIQSP